MRNPVLLATLLGVLLLPNVASANGPCGQDFDGNHACGITSPASDNGSLTTANESDFYVFYARQGTELHLTLTNTQDPSCSTGGPESCGNPFMELDDARGNEIAESNTSVPNNGVTVPATMDITLQATGTYYVQVEFAGCCLGPPEENGNEQPDPYTLSVSASPNVQWPPPAPPVKVKSSPSAGADRHGDQYVTWQGTDGGLWERWYVGGRWYGPAKISNAGTIASAPAIAVHANGEQDIFWRGNDGNLWEAWYSGRWHGAVSINSGQLGSGPAAGVDSRGDQFVYWQGTDGGLWERWYMAGRWHGPARIGNAGTIASTPTVAVHANGEQDVFWRGTDGNLWEAWFTSGWSGAVAVGG